MRGFIEGNCMQAFNIFLYGTAFPFILKKGIACNLLIYFYSTAFPFIFLKMWIYNNIPFVLFESKNLSSL